MVRILALASLGVALLSSCAIHQSEFYQRRGHKKDDSGWRFRPLIEARYCPTPKPENFTGTYFVAIVAEPVTQPLGTAPTLDSIRVYSRDGNSLTFVENTCPPLTDNGSIVFDFGIQKLPESGSLTQIEIFYVTHDTLNSHTEFHSSTMDIAPVKYRYVGSTYDSLDCASVQLGYSDRSGGLSTDLSFRYGDHVRAGRLLGLGAALHTGGWTFRLNWSLFEWWNYKAGNDDDLEDDFSVTAAPMATYRAIGDLPGVMLGALLTPDVTLERNLDRAHKWKLYVGNDLLLSPNDWASGDEYADSTHSRGLLIAPKVGLQVPIWVFRVRLYGSYNHWWRFDRRNLDLGWTFGTDLIFMNEEFSR